VIGGAGVKVVEKARVISVESGRALVAMKGDDTLKCSACPMAAACETKEHRFSVKAPEGVKAGDEVTVEMDAPAVAALLVFMVPLVAAFLAGGAVYGLTRSGALGIVSGIAGAAAVYVAIYLAGRGDGHSVSIVDRPGPDSEDRPAGLKER
jgi:positive regulator of sigma E activity